MNPRVLLVDDDPNVLEGHRRSLGRRYDITLARGGVEALIECKRNGPFAVVVSDLRMPGIDGIKFLARIREIAPDTVRLILTGNAAVDSAIQAVNDGHVFRFLTKPCPRERLVASIDASLRQYELQTGERALLEKTLHGCVELLTDLMQSSNTLASPRTAALVRLARTLAPDIGEQEPWELECTPMMAQVGTLTLPDAILRKVAAGQALSEQEEKLYNSHPGTGRELLRRIPRMERVADNVGYQWKQYDGRGLPADNVTGEQIPVGARLLMLIADYDELVSRGRSKEEAIQMLEKRSSRYDPRLLELLAVHATAENGRFRLMPLADLEVGMVLPEGIRLQSGQMLVRFGEVLHPATLARIRNFSAWQQIIEPVAVQVPPAKNDGAPLQ